MEDKLTISWITVMKKFLIFSGIIFLGFLVSYENVYSKKMLPRVSQTSKGKKTTSASQGTASTKVRFRSDKRAIVVTFSNLSSARKADYVLSYNTRGTTQGASGTITALSRDTLTRELLFGTCSHGVCSYDSGITNARFKVTITLASGKKLVKNYRLKV